MPVEYIALVVSIFSVLFAALSLGWNIYRDIILKARVDVSFSIVEIIHVSIPERPSYLNIKVTNFGPGPVSINMICVKEAQLWRRIMRKTKFGVITQDYTNAMSSKLPAKIEVGDKIELFLSYDRNCFLRGSHFTHIGVNDYYGRVHWAPKRDLTKAYSGWKKDFPSET